MSVLAFDELVFSLLPSISWRVTAVALLVGLLTKVGRVKGDSVSHSAWAAVLIGMLIFPLCFVLLPYVHVPLLPAVPRMQTAARSPLWIGLMAAHIVGSAAMLVRMAAGLLGVRSLVRGGRAIDSPRLNHQLRRVTQTWSGKPPIVLCSAAVRAPVTVGYFRPRIVLPADWPEWDEAKMASVLAHEVAHVRRGDYLLRVLASLNECLYWFHPLAWYVSRRLSLLSEKICDGAAVRCGGGDGREYARHLLEVAARGAAAATPAERYGLAMVKQSQIRQRVEAVLNAEHGPPEGRGGRTRPAVVALLVYLCWLVAATLCFTG